MSCWLMVTAVVCITFHSTGEAAPISNISSRKPPPESTRYHGHRVDLSDGERLRLQCDARIAGLDADVQTAVVWRLTLRRMAYSGCAPTDPVYTVAEMVYQVNGDQFSGVETYKQIPGLKNWTIYMEGISRNGDTLGNVYSAWIELGIPHTHLEDSGVFRCEALIGDTDPSKPKYLFSTFTRLLVTPLHNTDKQVRVQESLVPPDYDASVVDPAMNHVRVGQRASVHCVPRMMRTVPSSPFAVSKLSIFFLPYWRANSVFEPVAQYFPLNDTFTCNPPYNRKWMISHRRNNATLHDGATTRLDIEINIALKEDSGIFLCLVESASSGQTYTGVAGLKVSGDDQLIAGLCSLNQSFELDLINQLDGLSQDRLHTLDNDLDLIALNQQNFTLAAESAKNSTDDSNSTDGGEDDAEAASSLGAFGDLFLDGDTDPACFIAVFLMIVCVIAIVFIILQYICKLCARKKEKKKQIKPKLKPKPKPKPKPPKKKKPEKKKKPKKKKTKPPPAPSPAPAPAPPPIIPIDPPTSGRTSPFTAQHIDFLLYGWPHNEGVCIPPLHPVDPERTLPNETVRVALARKELNKAKQRAETKTTGSSLEDKPDNKNEKEDNKVKRDNKGQKEKDEEKDDKEKSEKNDDKEKNEKNDDKEKNEKNDDKEKKEKNNDKRMKDKRDEKDKKDEEVDSGKKGEKAHKGKGDRKIDKGMNDKKGDKGMADKKVKKGPRRERNKKTTKK